MAVLLAIAHGSFDEVPQSMPALELFFVCMVSDKYDTMQLLKPFARAWASNVLNSSCLYLIWVWYCFGIEGRFRDVLDRFARSRLMNEEGELLGGDHNEKLLSALSYIPMVDKNLASQIAAIRLEQLDCYVQQIQHVLTDLEEATPTSGSIYCLKDYPGEKLQSDQFICRTALFGSLVRALRPNNLYPLLGAEYLLCSDKQMESALQGVAVQTQMAPKYHADCMPSFRTGHLAVKVTSDALEKVMAGYKDRLAANAKKVGCEGL